jgi:hypothetical protein
LHEGTLNESGPGLDALSANPSDPMNTIEELDRYMYVPDATRQGGRVDADRFDTIPWTC